MRIIANRHKPLIAEKGKVITYHNNNIYELNVDTGEARRITTLPCNLLFRLFGKMRIFERLLRLEVKTAIRLSEHEILISRNGSVYSINTQNGHVNNEHSYRPNMNNPYAFAKIEGISGFDDCIVYGEYIGRTNERFDVSIYARDIKNAKWQKVFSFAKAQVRHIHRIVPDRCSNCVYILTGDLNEESGIWVAYDNFNKVVPLLVGSQEFRCVELFPIDKDKFVYATDTALVQNYIYKVDINDGNEIQRKCVTDIDGSCLSGTADEEFAYFSTTVENDERVTGLKTWFDYGRSPGIKSEFVQLICVNKENHSFKKILEIKKDCLPCRLFQYGYFCVLADEMKKRIYVYPVALKKYDGKLILLEKGKDY